MRRRAAPSSPGKSPSPPPRKAPALPGTPPTNDDLTRLFKCRECSHFALPPIIQCERGHLVCRGCRPKLTRCPVCRTQLRCIRNLALEKLAGSLLFPCKYASSGCAATLRHAAKADHEEVCTFRPCPRPGTDSEPMRVLMGIVTKESRDLSPHPSKGLVASHRQMGLLP